jgi:hypothetical protein
LSTGLPIESISLKLAAAPPPSTTSANAEIPAITGFENRRGGLIGGASEVNCEAARVDVECHPTGRAPRS